MGADLVVKSEVGIGSTFTVVLPRAAPIRAPERPLAYTGERLVH